jgi:MFS family permease
MLSVFTNTAPLLLGMFLIMVGNGLQGTALGVRGGIEEFGNAAMGFVMSGYFVGFLGGAQITPWLLRRVGHVRVFAALASLISAAMILFAAVVDPIAWVALRVVVGFCMSGVYVVAESWLNEAVENERRGQLLSAYLIVQMLGIVIAQVFLNLADPAGYNLFVIMAVVVSVAVVPILLSVSPAPVFERTRHMALGQVFRTSPLSVVGTVLLGGVFACLFGMASVYATQIGLSNAEISIFIGAIYVGGMALQYPIGWMSDRMDRRLLIEIVAAVGALACVAVLLFEVGFAGLVAAAFLVGGAANPLYSLMVAHLNDFLEREDMASASGAVILLNGVGAAGTPIIVGVLMDAAGPQTFMMFVGLLMASIAVYGIYRSTRRPATPVDETLPYTPIPMGTSQVASAVIEEQYAEYAEEAAEATGQAEEPYGADAGASHRT